MAPIVCLNNENWCLKTPFVNQNVNFLLLPQQSDLTKIDNRLNRLKKGSNNAKIARQVTVKI
jgi:hypothetical protein